MLLPLQSGILMSASYSYSTSEIIIDILLRISINYRIEIIIARVSYILSIVGIHPISVIIVISSNRQSF